MTAFNKAEAIKQLDEAIEQYSNFKLDGKPTAHEDIGLHEETIISRAAIHDMLVELRENGVNYDVSKLAGIDRQWQDWIESEKDKDFEVVGLERESEPKYEWWFWIDNLNELTPEQKSTL